MDPARKAGHAQVPGSVKGAGAHFVLIACGAVRMPTANCLCRQKMAKLVCGGGLASGAAPMMAGHSTAHQKTLAIPAMPAIP